MMKLQVITFALCVAVATATSYYTSYRKYFCFPPSLANGSVYPRQRFYTSYQRVRLRCDDGYDMSGKSILRCRYGKWDNDLPVCKGTGSPVKRCTRPKDPENGYVLPRIQATFRPTEKVWFRCRDGYERIGEGDISCREDGSGWSHDFPTCRRIQEEVCGAPTTPENGGFLPERDSYPLGRSVRFSCSEGFQLEGSEAITCLAGGRWSNDEPSCNARSCERPIEVENGYFEPDLEIYPVGERAWYVCNDTYFLEGEKDITCLSSGEWSHPFPSCEGIPTCGPPASPANGGISPDKEVYAVGEIVTFTCNENFVLEGTESVVCLPDDNWSLKGPFCRPIQAEGCIPPESLENGVLEPVKDLFETDERLWFSCNEGFFLDGGPRDLTCLEDGTWDEPFPTCSDHIPTCASPEFSPNGDITPDQDAYEVGDIITFSCDDDFELVGEESLLCLPNGWADDVPTCRRKYPMTCKPPDPVQNGYYLPQPLGIRYPIGYYIKFVCEFCYWRNGPIYRRCQSNGLWSERAPTCSRRSTNCPKPRTPENGSSRSTRADYRFRTRVFFKCDSGFRLQGRSTIVCLETGRWSASEPTCEREIVTCSKPPVPSNGYIINERDSYAPGAEIWYKCNRGFIARGTKDLQCQEDGSWLPEPSFRCHGGGIEGGCTGHCGGYNEESKCLCNYTCTYKRNCCKDFFTSCPHYVPRFPNRG